MSDGHPAAADTIERHLEATASDLTGPVQVLATIETPAGETGYEVSASRLIPLDPDDPALADVFVPVPVTARVNLIPGGTPHVEISPVDADVEREVRAWVRTLIASGSVSGIARAGPSYGPPKRPTHEIIEDATGRRVLRRVGFVLS